MGKTSLKMMILSALFCAIIAVCAQISITFLPPVPFTMQNFAVALTVVILGRRYGTLAILLYILVGAIGAPVFAKFNAGLPVLVGPTGGYLIGYIVSAFVMGTMIDRGKLTFMKAFIVNIVGLAIIHVAGVIQLKLVGSMTWDKAIGIDITFILPDLIKIILASYIGIQVRRRLALAGLLPNSLNNEKIVA
ncbi:biotin transporter BioY [Aneurinibacillus thermoaerophilus]|jgi:biotin transport system substrate-specific component|uniref:biotin transporter BioY n=1 Tax=Aneurinibacillus thermoaerophilus TaxID=143495 RepID=UPI002E22D65F|nr:biotin transporter BioY [Aneurinibacillus thermoaerophilus]MED0678856.1 biotin transporter BioY [Aneurinibacillus thermoaerophilus]MED0736393.1 biotin transporter BioY [Aneurinibacillus thermoaerophilus]MED0763056.1 biotin transporter BioY [Aneurinibacillus thermoaerophilus]